MFLDKDSESEILSFSCEGLFIRLQVSTGLEEQPELRKFNSLKQMRLGFRYCRARRDHHWASRSNHNILSKWEIKQTNH